jgi:peptide/nickel transport system substrate-binding protein
LKNLKALSLIQIIPTLVLWGCFLVLTGCYQNPNTHLDYRFGIAQKPMTLDPRYATDAASERVNRLLYIPLVDFDENARLKPKLASWSWISPQCIRFKLGSAHRIFHDGTRLSAEDVKATYQSILEHSDSPHHSEFSFIDHMRVLDENTLDVYLVSPNRHALERFIIGIMPKHLIESGGDIGQHPIGSGPLSWVDWSHDLHLERVRDHQRITLVEIKDPTVRVLKLLRGEIDLLQGDLPPELEKYLKTQSQIRVLESRGQNFSYLGINFRHAALSDWVVRDALMHGIDREAIIQHALLGQSRMANAILPPEHWAGNPNLSLPKYDAVYSREQLKKAGYNLPIRLIYKTSTDPQRLRIATMMQAQLKPAGFDLQIRSLDWGTFFGDVKAGQFDLYGLTWVGLKTPDIYEKSFASWNTPPRGFNRGFFKDPILDGLLLKDNYRRITKRIDQTIPVIPLWYEGQFAAINSAFKDFSPKPDGNWDDLAWINK